MLKTPVLRNSQLFESTVHPTNIGELLPYPPKSDFLTRMSSFSILLLPYFSSIQLITVVFLKKIKYQQQLCFEKCFEKNFEKSFEEMLKNYISSQANFQTNSQANFQTNSQANSQADSQANPQANSQASSQANF